MYQGNEHWLAVDSYFTEKLAFQDDGLTGALDANAAAGLPAHDVSPLQGKFLALLTKLVNARKVLEIGTLGGYSTIWFARAMSDGGKVTSLEVSPDYAAVARRNLGAAGVANRVNIMVGPALTSLARLHQESAGPFDLIFIDADKPSNPAYLGWALKLARPGTLIVGDNVVRDGAITDAASSDDRVQGVRAFTNLLADTPGLFSTAMQTVGQKGWDGMTISLVEAADASR